MWSETPRSQSGKKGKAMNKDRFISKMFLRGDKVESVLRIVDKDSLQQKCAAVKNNCG
jgi:hypothetical protein